MELSELLDQVKAKYDLDVKAAFDAGVASVQVDDKIYSQAELEAAIAAFKAMELEKIKALELDFV